MHKTELSLSEHIKSESITASKSLLIIPLLSKKSNTKSGIERNNLFFIFKAEIF